MVAKRRATSLIIGVVVLSSFLVGKIEAQPMSALSISPLTFEITANPGETISNVVRVTNVTDGLVYVTMGAQDFTAAGEAGQVVVKEEMSQTYSLARWIRVEPQVFELGPRSQQLVNFTISVPVDGEPGGHYGTIIASLSGGEVPGGTAIVQKVGALLLLQVTGEVKELLWVKSFETPRFSEYGPIELSVRFENQGTIHLKPRGFVSISNWLGKEVVKLSLEQKNVLPNSVRAVATTWDEKWLFGKYTATLAAIYGSTNETLSAVTTFWVLPWRIMALAGVGLLGLIVFFYLTRKRWKMALRALIKGEKGI